MKTKAFHAFETKLIYFDDDIDLIDVLRINVSAGKLTAAGSPHVLTGIDPAKHAHLARRQNSEGSRTLVMNHLRNTLFAAYVKDVYEEVTHYLRALLEKAAANGFDSRRIIGEHSVKLDANDILQAGTYDAIAKLIADNVFQALESEQSTLKLLEKVSSKLALKVDPALIAAALPYLEVRHLLVHSDGRINPEFVKEYPNVPLRDGYVLLDGRFMAGLRDSVKALIKDYDVKAVAANLVKPEDVRA